MASPAAGVAGEVGIGGAWQRCLAGVCGLGLTATVLVHHTDWMRPLLVQLSGPATADRPMPMRAATTRRAGCCGWRALGKAVGREAAELAKAEQQRADPPGGVELGSCRARWAFYRAGHPQAYSGIGSSDEADRHSPIRFVAESRARRGGLSRSDVHRRRLGVERGEGGF